MDLLKHLSEYKVLRDLVLESSSFKPWWWRRRGLANLIRETVEKFRTEYEEVLGQVFFTRLNHQDFFLYHYVIREELDLSTPGHQISGISFVVYVLERWALVETRFGRDYLVDSLVFPLWQRVRSELRWQSRQVLKPVRRFRRSQAIPAEQRQSMPFPFQGDRPTEPLLPSFRLSRSSPPSPNRPQSPLPALVVNQSSRVPPPSNATAAAPGCAPPPTVMIPTSRGPRPRSCPSGAIFTSSSIDPNPSQRTSPPRLPPKLYQHHYQNLMLSETTSEMESLTVSSPTPPLPPMPPTETPVEKARDDSGSSSRLSSEREGSYRKVPGTPARCRRALQL